MRGRNAVDPELARVVEERLERLLAERAPRRAREDDRPRAGTESDDGTSDAGLDFAGTDDEDADDGGTSPSRRRRHRAGDRERSPDQGTSEVPQIGGRRLGFTRVHLTVVGMLVLLGLLLGGWAVLRATPVPLPAAAVTGPSPGRTGSGPTAPEDPDSPSPSARASPTSTPGRGLVVHVLGAVRKPGLVELPELARVQDAIEVAGGLRPGARLGDLNLAQPLADGQQLVVGKDPGGRSEVRGGTGAAGGGAGSDGPPGVGSSAGEKLDLNAATSTQLETLPGVGPVTAAKIIGWREEHGRFNRVEELQEVSGIGPKTYAEIAPYCRV